MVYKFTVKNVLIKNPKIVQYDPNHPTNVEISKIAKQNKEDKVVEPQAMYNQDIAGLQRRYPELMTQEKRLTTVDPNNETDDGWNELREAQILARKKMVGDVQLLEAIKNDPGTSRREKIRAMEQTFNIATEKVGPTVTGDTYNINALIQILTGNR